MEIRFVSSLTADEENQFAPAVLRALGSLLDQFPIAYTVRIETTGAKVYQHSHLGNGAGQGGASNHREAKDTPRGISFPTKESDA